MQSLNAIRLTCSSFTCIVFDITLSSIYQRHLEHNISILRNGIMSHLIITRSGLKVGWMTWAVWVAGSLFVGQAGLICKLNCLDVTQVLIDHMFFRKRHASDKQADLGSVEYTEP